MNFLTKTATVSALALGLMMSVAASPTEAPKVERQQYVADVVLTSNNTVVLDGVVDSVSTSRALMAAKEIDSKTPSADPLYLILNTPGGSIDSGLSMIEQMSTLNRPVITVTLFAASMGFQTVQGIPGKRYIVQNGTLMSHRPRGGFQGEFTATGGGGSQLNTRYKYYQERVARMDRKAVERSGGKITFEEYQALIAPEYWCDGQDCVDKGFADKVVTVICDSSLNGSKEDSQTKSFFGIELTITSKSSNCPLITGSPMESLKFVNGKELGYVDMKKETGYNKELEAAIQRQFQDMADSTHPNDFLSDYLKGTRQVIGY